MADNSGEGVTGHGSSSPPRHDGVAASVVQQAWLGDVSVDGRIVRTIVCVVLFLQFVVPIVPTLVNHMLVSRDANSVHGGNVQCKADGKDPLCDCEDSAPWQKLLQPDFLGTNPFESQFRFYDVHNTTCKSRVQQSYVEYAMKDSCLAEVVVRDEDSCREAATRMMPQGSQFVWTCWEDSPEKRACESMPVDHVKPPAVEVGQLCNITNQHGRLTDFIHDMDFERSNGHKSWILEEAGGQRVHLRLADGYWLDQHADMTTNSDDREGWTLNYTNNGRIMLQSSAGSFLHEVDRKLHVSGETGLSAEWDVTPRGYSEVFLTSHRNQRLSYCGIAKKTVIMLYWDLADAHSLPAECNGYGAHDVKWELFDVGQGNFRLRSQPSRQWLQERNGSLVLSDAVGGTWRIEATDDDDGRVLLKSSGGLYLHDDLGHVVLDAKAGPTGKWALTHTWRYPTVIHFSAHQQCSIWTRGQEFQYADTRLKYCFVLDPVHTQISTLCLALLVAVVLSSLGHTAHEAEDPSIAAKVRRGAMRMATQQKVGALKATAALAVRFFQTVSSVGCILLLLFSLRPALALLVLLLATLPLFGMYGGSVFKQPTLLVSPPDFSLFFSRASSQKAKFHLMYLALLHVATVAVLGYNGALVLQTGEVHGVDSVADNFLAMLSLAKQGALAMRIVSGWSIAFSVAVFFHVNFVAMMTLFDIHAFELPSSATIMLLFFSPLVNLLGMVLVLIRVAVLASSPVMLMCGAKPLSYMPKCWDLVDSWDPVDLHSTIMELAKTLQEAAAKRSNDREGTLLSASDHTKMLEVGLWESSSTMNFPEGVQPTCFVDWSCWWMPLPGKLTRDLALLFADIVTDTYAWSTFLRRGHVLFAGFLALASWTSTLIQLREGSLGRAVFDARESHMAGIPTAGWIHLLDTEKGLEALVALIVQGYGNFFAGFTFPIDAASNSLSILLSMVGIATYLRDNFDYEGVPGVRSTKSEEEWSCRYCLMLFVETIACAFLLSPQVLASYIAIHVSVVDATAACLELPAGAALLLVACCLCCAYVFYFVAKYVAARYGHETHSSDSAVVPIIAKWRYMPVNEHGDTKAAAQQPVSLRALAADTAKVLLLVGPPAIYACYRIYLTSVAKKSGGCFAPSSLVTRVDEAGRETSVALQELRRGDALRLADGALGRVRCVVKIARRPMRRMARLPGGLCITPGHPICWDGQWMRPRDVHGVELKPCVEGCVYNVLLDSGHVLLVDGVQCVTWGHGFEGDVLGHEFFGTKRVVCALAAMPGWSMGFVETSGLLQNVKGEILGFKGGHMEAAVQDGEGCGHPNGWGSLW
eukprot:TRINITY_DN11812_c0_g2_i1.p1 TRINITY_DN11812_c0_g2~~TRINITY_DN11812_c0_g2_i1.p1  ORF type:complete len:1322 (-),score=164.88 TRINITY_DN11812_c0_g2_i1:362-4327(-)